MNNKKNNYKRYSIILMLDQVGHCFFTQKEAMFHTNETFNSISRKQY